MTSHRVPRRGTRCGTRVLLEGPDHGRRAYVEAQDTGALYSDAEKVSTLTQRYGMIRMQALGADESVAFIRRVAGGL
ncbi:Scr1 family TA system antitoxin-like transcriptional regulator [Kitasatospora sp. NPDC091207]|uniref:Scr1 family TA system antitoxin-like transcriptional regulator n=1 Tax=Kitasatospora sp. NPDC091207 TaxID=3364083 RepID=UPI0038290417